MSLREVPSGFTGELKTYLQEIRAALNVLPTFSTFSGLTPEGVVSAVAGTIAIAPFSGSTQSTAYIKLGSPTFPSTASWARLSIQTLV